MTIKSIATFALSLALVAAFAAPALADETRAKASYPMQAAEFQQKVDARLAHQQARMEKRITDKSIDADRAKDMRAHFAERSAKVQAAASAAEADGVVTADEAKAVREAGGGHKHEKKS